VSIWPGLPYAVGAAVIDFLAVILAVAIIVRAVSVFEVLLLLLLARPMWDFVRVLRDMSGPDVPNQVKHSPLIWMSTLRP